jgi:galactitol-specific phosphotransferase system IIB component
MADGKTMQMPNQLATRELSTKDQEFLRQREEVIQKALLCCVKAGRALLEIRNYKDGLFYKSQYTTFENYCRQRFGIGRPYAYQTMDAAEVYDDLSARADKECVKVNLPENEKQLRQLKKLPRELRLEAWLRASNAAGSGRVTSTAVAKEVRQLAVKNGVCLNRVTPKKINGKVHDCAIIIAHERIAMEEIRGTRLDSFLKPTGIVYFKLGDFLPSDGVEILARWNRRCRSIIAVIGHGQKVQTTPEPVACEPVLVGVPKSQENAAGVSNIVLTTEQIADWGERLPAEFSQYVDDTTAGSRMIHTIEHVIGLKKVQEPDESSQFEVDELFGVAHGEETAAVSS